MRRRYEWCDGCELFRFERGASPSAGRLMCAAVAFDLDFQSSHWYSMQDAGTLDTQYPQAAEVPRPDVEMHIASYETVEFSPTLCRNDRCKILWKLVTL